MNIVHRIKVYTKFNINDKSLKSANITISKCLVNHFYIISQIVYLDLLEIIMIQLLTRETLFNLLIIS